MRAEILKTPEDVIRAFGLNDRSEYYGLIPYDQGLGFSVFRRYPSTTALGAIVDRNGEPAVHCHIRVSVYHASQSGYGISAVELDIGWWKRYGNLVGRNEFLDPGIVVRTAVDEVPKPLELDFRGGEFVHDSADGRLYGPSGPMTGPEILDHVFNVHVRTLRRRFRLRWKLVTALWRAAQRGVTVAERALLVVLDDCYRIRRKDDPRAYRPFHAYSFSDFRRDESEEIKVLGLKTSRRALLTNLVVVLILLGVLHLGMPNVDLLSLLLRNSTISTIAFVSLFVLVDLGVPGLLKAGIVALSRLKPYTYPIRRKVRV